jgi:hypothetical protein
LDAPKLNVCVALNSAITAIRNGTKFTKKIEENAQNWSKNRVSTNEQVRLISSACWNYLKRSVGLKNVVSKPSTPSSSISNRIGWVLNTGALASRYPMHGLPWNGEA